MATTLSKIRKREVQTDMKKAHEELVLARKTAKAIAGSILTFWSKANKVCFEICRFFINSDGV